MTEKDAIEKLVEILKAKKILSDVDEMFILKALDQP